MKKTPHNSIDPSKVIVAVPDFETLSLDSDAVIIGLGAVVSGPRRRYKVSHFPINALVGQYRRSVDPDTYMFWRTRKEHDLRLAFERAVAGEGIDLAGAIDDLLKTCESAIAYHGEGASIFWVFKPAIFDGAVLQSACRTLGPAFEKRLDAVSGGVYRRQALDLNSLKFAANIAGREVERFPRPDNAHHPYSDAAAQFSAYELVVDALRAAPEVEQAADPTPRVTQLQAALAKPPGEVKFEPMKLPSSFVREVMAAAQRQGVHDAKMPAVDIVRIHGEEGMTYAILPSHPKPPEPATEIGPEDKIFVGQDPSAVRDEVLSKPGPNDAAIAEIVRLHRGVRSSSASSEAKSELELGEVLEAVTESCEAALGSERERILRPAISP